MNGAHIWPEVPLIMLHWSECQKFTLLSPFHLSTRWILLKSLTPVNTVKTPESESFISANRPNLSLKGRRPVSTC